MELVEALRVLGPSEEGMPLAVGVWGVWGQAVWSSW